MPIDYKTYPADWSEVRERILIRDHHTCKHCGIHNYSVGYRDQKGTFYLISKHDDYRTGRCTKHMMNDSMPEKIILIILTVAHLDHDEWNHDVKDDRLAALCQRCHLNYDRVDNENRKKYGKYYRRFQ